ncbi:MAG TPA: hypothetical protein DEA43_03905 [Candidatus Moranbacteria bacterium]|nr:hypothetical protein [Candidatus Moranbacteria bacterium]HBT45998.1 hypothetical protein [Candidatus Moranbacteria bacterium]
MNIFENSAPNPVENPAIKKEEPIMGASRAVTTEEKIRRTSIATAEGIFDMYLKRDEKLNMEEFGDVYPVEEIKKDRERVEYIKKGKDYKEPTKESVVLENMFTDLVEKYNWFGEGVKVVQLSEFDDKIASGAHCDVVLEFSNADGSVTRIGVDLTTAINYDTLNKKKSKCLDAVKSGKFFSVKYFKSKIDDTKGKIDDVPVFFAGIDKETLNMLCESLAKQKNTGMEILEKHEGQSMFIKELLTQADVYYGSSIINNGEDGYATKKMDYYQRLFDQLYEDKKSLRSNGFEKKALQDKVFEYIAKFV